MPTIRIRNDAGSGFAIERVFPKPAIALPAEAANPNVWVGHRTSNWTAVIACSRAVKVISIWALPGGENATSLRLIPGSPARTGKALARATRTAIGKQGRIRPGKEVHLKCQHLRRGSRCAACFLIYWRVGSTATVTLLLSKRRPSGVDTSTRKGTASPKATPAGTRIWMAYTPAFPGEASIDSTGASIPLRLTDTAPGVDSAPGPKPVAQTTTWSPGCAGFAGIRKFRFMTKSLVPGKEINPCVPLELSSCRTAGDASIMVTPSDSVVPALLSTVIASGVPGLRDGHWNFTWVAELNSTGT